MTRVEKAEEAKELLERAADLIAKAVEGTSEQSRTEAYLLASIREAAGQGGNPYNDTVDDLIGTLRAIDGIEGLMEKGLPETAEEVFDLARKLATADVERGREVPFEELVAEHAGAICDRLTAEWGDHAEDLVFSVLDSLD